MVMKCVRKLWLVMMGLLIHTLIYVQANGLAPFSFYPSSPPILFPYSPKVDEAPRPKMHKCLTNVVKRCESKKENMATCRQRISILY
jgi:hypothetical protein